MTPLVVPEAAAVSVVTTPVLVTTVVTPPDVTVVSTVVETEVISPEPDVVTETSPLVVPSGVEIGNPLVTLAGTLLGMEIGNPLVTLGGILIGSPLVEMLEGKMGDKILVIVGMIPVSGLDGLVEGSAEGDSAGCVVTEGTLVSEDWEVGIIGGMLSGRLILGRLMLGRLIPGKLRPPVLLVVGSSIEVGASVGVAGGVVTGSVGALDALVAISVDALGALVAISVGALGALVAISVGL